MLMFKKSQLYLITGLILLIVVFFFVAISSTNSPTQTSSPLPIPIFSPQPLNSSQPLEIKPILTNEVPLKPQSEGGGADLNSSLVQKSQSEITKILPFLPYENKFTVEEETISISIPSAQFQTTPWVLDVQIFGIDYQVTEQDASYALQKNAFLSASSSVFSWMRDKGINPENVIINWGDRLYIRERAEGWLSE